jgi:hypothetical protein
MSPVQQKIGQVKSMLSLLLLFFFVEGKCARQNNGGIKIVFYPLAINY